MFYSNQLLARKAPLGQIWRAATLHAKINRRNLNKLNIINICEEILNPSVPMALRLSGILMGGVVIVYERKVKLLYEDVTRFLVEINEAWKVKAKRDTTILPKGKSQAKYEAVTLPDNQPTELGDIEELLQFSNSQTLIGIHNKMNLDNIDDSYINPNIGEADLPHDHHQADIENITIPDPFDSHQTDARYFNKYERFDIEGDEIEGNEETQENFPSENHTLVPSPPLQENFPSENHTRVPSPPLQDEPQNSNEIHEQSKADHTSHHSEHKAQRIPRRQKPSRKRTKKTVTMDYEHTMIPGQMYQSWLQDASDIVSRRGRKRKHSSSMKIGKLMDLPPVAIMDSLFTDGNKDVYYPQPLLKQWMILTQPVQDVPPRETSPPHPPAPSSHSPPETNNYHDQTTFPFEDHHSGAGSESVGLSVEKQRLDVNNHEMPEIPSGILNNGVSVTGGNEGPVREADVAVTPANSGGQLKSLSSESGPGFLPVVSDISSIRSHKKRLFSSGRRSGSSLEPVAEDFAFNQNDPIFEVRLSPEAETNDLILETGPTQTQKAPLPDQPMEQLTDSIRRQLKTYFDTPGSAQTESLNQLAYGLDRKKAACLFYQTCVLATRNIIRVQQTKPYGDIAISRGAKM